MIMSQLDPKRMRSQAIERLPAPPGLKSAFTNGIKVESIWRDPKTETSRPSYDESDDEYGVDGIRIEKINISDLIKTEGEDAQYFPVRDGFARANVAARSAISAEDEMAVCIKLIFYH